MASKRERPPGSGHWELRAYTGSESGQRRYVTRTFRGTERQAEKACRRFAVEVEDRAVPAAAQGTVAGLFEDWWAAHPWKTGKSRAKAREDIDRYITPQLGHLDVIRVTDADIDRLYAGLKQGTLSVSGRALEPSTVRRLHSTVHAGFEWGVRKRRIRLNPAGTADVPAVPPTAVEAPDPAVVAALLTAARHSETPDLEAFLATAAGTGRRRQDLLGLRVDSVDLDAKGGPVLTFARRAVYIPGQGVTTEALDKNGRSVALGIDDGTAAHVEAHLRAMGERCAFFGARLTRKSFVFTDDPACRAPGFPDSFSRKFTKNVRAAARLAAVLDPDLDFEDVTLHTLRHFHATELLTAGVDMETVAHRLGDDPATIHRTYSHFRPAADRRAAQAWATIMAR